jgi:hypothetical protein
MLVVWFSLRSGIREWYHSHGGQPDLSLFYQCFLGRASIPLGSANTIRCLDLHLSSSPALRDGAESI